jgi:inner membrane protein
VPVIITADQLSKDLAFSMNIQLKGSGQLHFLPLSDNSHIQLKSSWPDPSFDGSSLPRQREVSDTGFDAEWSFNKANMPILDQILKTDANRESMAFGVSMIQPADQYAKTNRSIKYAILFIGLTFAMFFIIELMQKKNVHPVQYLLVGLALIIFYTLLLSISEYLGFNIAYAIAAGATIALVGMYAGSLFSSVKTSFVLSLFMALLYGFIYVLIQLEDTALLAGSIGLFIILAVAMYFSRRINWYGNNVTHNALAT